VASASDGLVRRLVCVVIEAGVVAHITMITRDFKSSENMERKTQFFRVNVGDGIALWKSILITAKTEIVGAANRFEQRRPENSKRKNKKCKKKKNKLLSLFLVFVVQPSVCEACRFLNSSFYTLIAPTLIHKSYL